MGHLDPLLRSRLISRWYDGCITPGEEWEPQIKKNLENAEIILLLISIDFIKSEYCCSVELTRAIERHCAGDACVIPVILRACVWQSVLVGAMTLGQLQALPKNALPIAKWADQDDACTNVAEGLLKTIQQLQQQREAQQQQAQAEAERQRQAEAEAQRKQQELAEAERKKQAAEAERQKRSAAEAQKLQTEAAAKVQPP